MCLIVTAIAVYLILHVVLCLCGIEVNALTPLVFPFALVGWGVSVLAAWYERHV
jgi:hypothetical protein